MSARLCSVLWLSLAVAGCGRNGIAGSDAGAGGCAHDPCAAGASLSASCDACAGAICAQDSFCCTTSWNSRCVAEVASICNQTCSGPTGGASDMATLLDAAPLSDGGDGSPTRQQCTRNFGSGLSAVHGRLDGYLVSIIAPGAGKQCNGDSSHVHLQVLMQGAVYDVAVDTGSTGDDIFYLAIDKPIPDGTWSEGWHPSDGLSYTSLGVKSTDFADLSPTAAPVTVEGELANVNHISVFGTGYGANGMHLIHYQSGGDGALVLEPQAASSRLLLFHFSSDHF